MSDTRPVLVVLEASQERRTLVGWLLGDDVPFAKDIGAALAHLGQSPVVLVDLAGDLERGLRAIEEVHAALPKAQIVAMAEGKDPDVILRAMRAGAREFAVPDEGSEFTDVVRGLLERASAEAPGAKILSVFPVKGGIGTTTVATNLAGALCAIGKRVLLVDLDRQLGDSLVFLDLAPRYSIADVLDNLHRLDRELLMQSLGRHASGLYVLPQPDSLDDGKVASASEVSAWLPFVARHFDYVVCDGFRGFDELSVAVLDASHRIELLLTQDVVALKNARRCLDVFQRLNYGPGKVDLVVNRHHARSPIDLDSIADNLGVAVRTTLANDHPAAVAALNKGLLLRDAAPRSQLTHDVALLAGDIAGVQPAKRTGLGALFRRSAAPPPPTDSVKPSAQKGGTFGVPRRTPEAG